jgi:hypothetical protein
LNKSKDFDFDIQMYKTKSFQNLGQSYKILKKAKGFQPFANIEKSKKRGR